MIKTVPISEFVSSLRKYVNVPMDFLMEEALLKSAQEFCRKSQFIRVDWPIKDVTVGNIYNFSDYLTLDEPGAKFKPTELLVINGTEYGDENEGQLFNSVDYNIYRRADIMFHFEFTQVVAVVVVEPGHGSTHLPQELYDDYLPGICSGAAADLLMQPDSDWSDPNLAAYHRAQFVESMREAKRFKQDSNPDDEAQRPPRQRSFY